MNKAPGRTRLLSEDSTSSTDSGCSVEVVVDDKTQFRPQVNAHVERKSRPSVRSTRRLAVSALIVGIVCCVILLVVGGYAMCSLRSMQESLAKVSSMYEPVCVPCIQVKPDPLGGADGLLPTAAGLDVHVSADGDTRMCCANTPAQYAVLFQLILKRQDAVKKLEDILGPSRGEKPAGDVTNVDTDLPLGAPPARAADAVSAHLLLDSKAPRSPNDTVQAWKPPVRSPMSHLRGEIVLRNNMLIVKREGLYFVYCQIMYTQHEAEPHPYPELSSSYVMRDSVLYPSYAGILLKARHTRASQADDRQSSFVGGLFFLHVGDVLHVQVATPALVAHDDLASFFGLFKVT